MHFNFVPNLENLRKKYASSLLFALRKGALRALCCTLFTICPANMTHAGLANAEKFLFTRLLASQALLKELQHTTVCAERTLSRGGHNKNIRCFVRQLVAVYLFTLKCLFVSMMVSLTHIPCLRKQREEIYLYACRKRLLLLLEHPRSRLSSCAANIFYWLERSQN